MTFRSPLIEQSLSDRAVSEEQVPRFVLKELAPLVRLIRSRVNSIFSAGTRSLALDFTYDPLAYWHFNLGLADLALNGHDLAVETGTERYAPFDGVSSGFLFDGSTTLFAASSAELALTGDMAFLATVKVDSYPAAAAESFLVSHNAAGVNHLYGLLMNDPGGAGSDGRALWYFHENGAGVDVSHQISNAWAGLSTPTLVGFSRQGNVVTAYVNGEPWGTASTVLAAPDTGSAGRLRFGGNSAGNRFVGMMQSAAIYGRALTAEEHLERYNATLSGAYGIK